MKRLRVPGSVYDYCDQSLITKTLNGYHKSKTKQGDVIRTLYGSYKLIRPMQLHGGLGDFIILSSCVDWLRKLEQAPTKTEIRRCMMYFQPTLHQSERKQLAETFFN